MFLVAMVFHANTIPNGYCLDDELVVDNEMVKKGIGGLKEIFITN